MRLKRFRLTFSGNGRAEGLDCVGVGAAHQAARAFLVVTNHATPARASIEALEVGAVTSFGEGFAVRIERWA